MTYPISCRLPTHPLGALGDDYQCVGSNVGEKTVLDLSKDDGSPVVEDLVPYKSRASSRALQRANIFQRFANRRHAANCVRLHSTLQGCKVCVDSPRSGTFVVHFLCLSHQQKFQTKNTAFQCEYHVVLRCARTKKKTGPKARLPWAIDVRNSNIEHSENCISHAKITYAEARMYTTDKSVTSIKDTVKRIATVNKISMASVPKSVAVKLREGNMYTGFTNYEVNWGKLDKWGQEFVEHNPGSKFHLEVDKEGRFKRMFVGLGSAARIARKTGIEFSGIDGTFLTHLKYNGRVLILVTRDGNNQILVLAWVICESENALNYQYMAQHIKGMDGLKEYLNRPRQLMYSDRHKGIPAFENEFECGKANCIVHIAKNVRRHVKKYCPKVSGSCLTVCTTDT